MSYSRSEKAWEQDYDDYDDEWSPSSYDYDSEFNQYWGGGPDRHDWVGRCVKCRRCKLIGENDWVSQGKWMNGVCDADDPDQVDGHRACGGAVMEIIDPLERDAMIAALLVNGEA